jgi:NADPH:quinone reductase-like Zn-dependent oxidoreductase
MGRYPLTRPVPVILGSDAAGIVEKTGSKVSRFAAGDNVISLLRQRWYGGNFNSHKASLQLGATVDGVFSEFYCFNELSLVKAPQSLSYEEASTLPTAGLTAHRILTQAGINPGDTVVIQGTGGVSLFALQLSKYFGFQTIATTGNKNNESLLRHLGAGAVINYKENPDWHKEVLALTKGAGADLILDVVGGTSVQKSVEAAAVNGQVALVGFLEDTTSTIDLVSVIRRNINLKAYTTGSAEDLEQFVKFMNTTTMKPVIAGVYSDYPTAFNIFSAQRTPGKIIVNL